MSELDIEKMLNCLCRAAEAFDGQTFASYFAEDGVYHDDFYGSFAGRERIAELINAWFYKHARDMRWDMIDPVYQAGRLYVRYVFSYKLEAARGGRCANDVRRRIDDLFVIAVGAIRHHRYAFEHRSRTSRLGQLRVVAEHIADIEPAGLVDGSIMSHRMSRACL